MKNKLILINALFDLAVINLALLVGALTEKVPVVIILFVPLFILRKFLPFFVSTKAKMPIKTTLGWCACSLFVFSIIVGVAPNLSTSMFFSLFMGITIYWIWCFIETKLENKQERILSYMELCKMTEDELRTYAKSKHLGEMMVDTLILRVIHNYRWCEIEKERNYSKTAIRYHKKQIETLLNIEF